MKTRPHLAASNSNRRSPSSTPCPQKAPSAAPSTFLPTSILAHRGLRGPGAVVAQPADAHLYQRNPHQVLADRRSTRPKRGPNQRGSFLEPRLGTKGKPENWEGCLGLTRAHGLSKPKPTWKGLQKSRLAQRHVTRPTKVPIRTLPDGFQPQTTALKGPGRVALPLAPSLWLKPLPRHPRLIHGTACVVLGPVETSVDLMSNTHQKPLCGRVV